MPGVEFPNREVLLSAVKSKLAEYEGTAVTVRQLYYRLVANGSIPNNLRAYKNLVAALSKWRRRRQIPFDAFEDRTRGVKEFDEGWRRDDPDGWLAAYLEAAVKEGRNYHLAKWAFQEHRVVVAVEKQALEGPFAEVCEDLAVDLAVCRGYASLSFLNEIGDALRRSEGRSNMVLYFGDFDPSGLNIPETVERDLRQLFHARFQFARIALTQDQIDDMNLVPAPVKMGDSRSGRFIEEHGSEVYELDAIEPKELQNLIRTSVEEHWDEDKNQERLEAEEKGKRRIERTLKKSGIPKLIEDLKPDDSEDDESEGDGD